MDRGTGSMACSGAGSGTAGTRARTLTQLQAEADAKGLVTWDVNVDFTVCRAHQHAAGATKRGDLQKQPPDGIFVEAADHALGRSSSMRSWKPSGSRGWVSAGRASVRTGSGPTRRTTPAATAPTCADAGSRPPSRSRRTVSATASSADREVGGRRRSTRMTTSSGTRSSAGSTVSSVTGPSPLGTTNSPSATKRPSWEQPLTSGCQEKSASDLEGWAC